MKNYKRELRRKECAAYSVNRQCTYEYNHSAGDITTWQLTPEQINEYLSLTDSEKELLLTQCKKLGGNVS